MKLSQLSGALQTIANLGIVGGLVMVLLQMQQNEKLLKLQITSQYFSEYIASDTALAGDNFRESYERMMMDPANMTMGDMRILEAQTFSPLARWVSLYRLSQAGLMDEAFWRDQVRMDAPYYYGTPWGKAWWLYYRDTLDAAFLPQELKDAINQRLEDISVWRIREGYIQIHGSMMDLIADEQAASDQGQPSN